MRRFTRFLLALLLVSHAAMAQENIKLHDDRLQLTLLAEHPRIVTPIGMAIDPHDAIFVIESHTHLAPDDYDGPSHDLIKVFRNTDGVTEEPSVFAEGLTAAMNLAFAPDGTLYVVCAREVFALPDADGDGRCDGPRRVVKLETAERYPHNSLLGLTFDQDGWMYIARGNVSSRHYRIRGSDDSFVEGYGDGGNIVRCRSDGSQVHEFATGFWNPFDLKFDADGRLLCVDNDPDARGPNRLLHIVRGGDYGYRSLFGGGGNHPYQGWDGSLPGTLPMISGTGEAPSGVIDCRRLSFPPDYQQGILVTVWNENTIELHKTKRVGQSLQAQRETLVAGPNDFRPVAFDSDSRGNLYVTDWVLVDYPNHGQGRIWKISTRAGVDRQTPVGRFQRHAVPSPSNQNEQEWLRQLGSSDPFARHAAEMELSAAKHRPALLRATHDDDARVRLGAILALKRGRYADAQTLLTRMLSDPDPRVRQASLIWIGQWGLVDMRNELVRSIDTQDVSAQLLETYIATVEILHQDFVRERANRSRERARDLPRKTDVSDLLRIVGDSTRPATLRAIALSRLPASSVEPDRSQLIDLAKQGPEALQTAAIDRLAGDEHAEVTEVLLSIALSSEQPSPLRNQALLALEGRSQPATKPLLALFKRNEQDVQRQVVRTLTASGLADEVRDTFLDQYEAQKDEAVAEQIELALRSGGVESGIPAPDRPQSLEQWQSAAQQDGDPRAGHRVFRSTQIGCAKCHTISGLGGRLGPDLSHAGQSLTRDQIVRSIVSPSDQFPPQYQAWVVTTVDGQVFSGLQLDHKARGAIEMYTTEGHTRHFDADEIDAYEATPRSLMPDGLVDQMTVSEFRDLVTFLSSLK